MEYQDILDDLKKTKTSYDAMFDYCTEGHYVMDNCIAQDFPEGWDTYCGSTETYLDKDGNEITQEQYNALSDEDRDIDYPEVYQYFIINKEGAEHFKRYTDETVIYNEELNLYVLCVYHCGTPWESVPSNWSDKPHEVEDD